MICPKCNGKKDLNWLEFIFGVRSKRIFYENGQYADFPINNINDKGEK